MLLTRYRHLPIFFLFFMQITVLLRKAETSDIMQSIFMYNKSSLGEMHTFPNCAFLSHVLRFSVASQQGPQLVTQIKCGGWGPGLLETGGKVPN